MVGKKIPPKKEFTKAFMKQLLTAREKQEKIKKARADKEKTKKTIAKIGEKLKPLPSLKKGEVRKKLEPMAVEKQEKKFIAPIYERSLPPLPKLPKITSEWPLPPPRPPSRPPEEEAAAPLVIPTPPAFQTSSPIPTSLPVQTPVPSPKEKRIDILDLGKLNLYIADLTVAMIQCDGANIPIKITKERRIEETNVSLSEEEIKNIIRKFSEAGNQAVTEPMFKITVNKLILSAVISAFSGSKFVITRE